MIHPGKELIEELRIKNLTQKDFSLMLGKRVSELNELIKGKRNITIQWDILLSQALGTPEKYWIHKQIDYDYAMIKKDLEAESKSSPKILDVEITTETASQTDKEESIPEDISTDILNSEKDNDYLKEDNPDISKTLQDSEILAEKPTNTNNLDRKKLEQKFMNF